VTPLAVVVDPHLEPRPRPTCSSRIGCDLAAFTMPEFRAGLVLAVVVLVLSTTFLLRSAQRSRVAAPVPVLGGLLLVTATGAYAWTDHLFAWPAGAVVVLVGGGWLATRRGAGFAVRALAAAPGAVLLAATPALRPLVPTEALVALAVVTVLGAVLVPSFDETYADRGLGPVCLAVSVVAVYETVPDTDLVLAILPAAVLLALLAWPTALGRLGTGGTFGVLGLLFLTVVVGGRGRLSAVVGGLACLGLMALEPAARRLSGGRTLLALLPASKRSTVVVGVAQLLLVIVVTRVAGTRQDVATALLVAVPTYALALVGLVVAARRLDRTTVGVT
jgi:hypothetical protein